MAFGKNVLVLYSGREKRTYQAHFEIAGFAPTADATIRKFCALVEALPKPARDLWNTAKIREFSVGVQAGAQPLASDFIIHAETVNRTAAIGARIGFTVYAPEQPQASVAKRNKNIATKSS
ncbi:MAG: hypothetical protein ABI811_01750 [Acidobacteriota bacterium]